MTSLHISWHAWYINSGYQIIDCNNNLAKMLCDDLIYDQAIITLLLGSYFVNHYLSKIVIVTNISIKAYLNILIN